MELLRTENLTRKFGELVAVNNVSISIEEKGVLSIIGPNGAGKTTFFNLLTGFLAPTGGKIFLRGEDITGMPPYDIVHKKLSRSFQIASYFPDFTIFENIQMGVLNHLGYSYNYFSVPGKLKEVNRKTEQYIEMLDLTELKNMKAKFLSHGDKKILDIAMCLTVEPEILLLDEPTSGVSGTERMKVIHFIGNLANRMKVVVVEHDMDIVFSISDRIVVLTQGSILADGTVEEVRKNQAVQNAYLGGNTEGGEEDVVPGKNK
jgi:branched-chain amino acid transport system ATP-binding protein